MLTCWPQHCPLLSALVSEPLEGVCVLAGPGLGAHPISLCCTWGRVICGNTGARLGKVVVASTHSIHSLGPNRQQWRICNHQQDFQLIMIDSKLHTPPHQTIHWSVQSTIHTISAVHLKLENKLYPKQIVRLSTFLELNFFTRHRSLLWSQVF